MLISEILGVGCTFFKNSFKCGVAENMVHLGGKKVTVVIKERKSVSKVFVCVTGFFDEKVNICEDNICYRITETFEKLFIVIVKIKKIFNAENTCCECYGSSYA